MIDYKIIESNRKTVCLQISDSGEVIVRVPYGFSKKKIKSFVIKNNEWIERTKKMQLENLDNKLLLTDDEIKKLKEYAHKKIAEKVDYFAPIMNVVPKDIKITSAKKRFGSCNSEKSLCFSYILMLYPDDAIEYVVVHELAHIKYHNHSKEFYNYIKKFLPDYKSREKLLKLKQSMPDFS